MLFVPKAPGISPLLDHLPVTTNTTDVYPVSRLLPTSVTLCEFTLPMKRYKRVISYRIVTVA